jgi:prepilin-type N-terminal cleavage/methylation domain-containing protein
MRNDRGMTLIEVLVALVLSFVIVIGLSSTGIFVLNENIRNTMRDEAVGVAEMSMEEARNTVFANLTTLPSASVVRQVRGYTVPYTVTRTVTNLDADNRQVVINVSWTRTDDRGTRSYAHQVATIVRRR